MPTPTTVATRLWYLLMEGAYIPREYYVLQDRALVYMPIYKTASTSIKTALLSPGASTRYPDYMQVHSEGDAGCHHLSDRQLKNYFTFSFVRDPFERLISCYEDRVRRPIYLPIRRYYFDSHYNRTLLKTLFGSQFHVDMDFPEFVSLVTQIPDVVADGHFKSQHAWTHRYGRRLPNYIGRLESISTDWARLAQRFNLADIEQRNASDRREVASYFTCKELVDAVAQRYRKDLVAFDYMDSYWRLRRVHTARSRSGTKNVATE